MLLFIVPAYFGSATTKTTHMEQKQENVLGERLRLFRLTKGYSQFYVATQLGLDQTTISRIERGETDPPIGLVRRMTTIYGRHLRDLD